jgi:hypothetical protein
VITEVGLINGPTALCWTLTAFSVLPLFTQPVGLPGRGISPSQGRYLHTGQHKHKRTQILMPRVGFEPTIPAFERAKTVHASDRAATVIGNYKCMRYKIKIYKDCGSSYNCTVMARCYTKPLKISGRTFIFGNSAFLLLELRLFLLIIFSGVRMSPLGPAAITGLLYQPHVIGDGNYGAIGGMKYSEETYPSASLFTTNPT